MNAERIRVLLADDDAVLRLTAGATLEGARFEVIEAADGEAAVEAFDAERPALVILDVAMPRLDGFQACAAIRQHPAGRDVPILMLTSRDDADAIDRTYEAGATDFATKGLCHRLLTQRVRFLLRAAAWRAEVIASRRRIYQVQQLARVGYWEVDGAGHTVEVSDIACGILRAGAGELRHLDQLVDALAPDAVSLLADALQDWRALARPFRLDLRLQDGTHLSVHGAPGQSDVDGRAGDLMLALQDTTALHLERERSRRMASEDALTGLPNRASIIELANGLLDSGSSDRGIAAIALCISGRARLLETLGGGAVDTVLKQTAERLCAAVAALPGNGPAAPRTAQLGYLGGGEFIALLDRFDATAVATVVETLLHAAGTSVDTGESQIRPVVHAGIARWPDDDSTGAGLISAALVAAASARNAPSRHVFHSPEIRAAARRRHEIEAALRCAIPDQLLWIAYQPRFDLVDLRLRGVEALLRLVHPKLGIVSPAEFIPIAEQADVIDELGAWVLRTACRHAAAWRREYHRGVEVSVNVSASQLRDMRALTAVVRQALHDSGLSPESLELELTESMIIRADDDVLRALQTLRQSGLRISLDDFGTGYSSLGSLNKLPIDCLKVDRSFVSALHRDAGAAGIAEAILAMARSLRLRTVAEGIETPEQMDFLRRHGCAEGQGFLLGKPMPADDLARLLKPSLATGQPARRLRAG